MAAAQRRDREALSGPRRSSGERGQPRTFSNFRSQLLNLEINTHNPAICEFDSRKLSLISFLLSGLE
jgi:hypothetical protein